MTGVPLLIAWLLVPALVFYGIRWLVSKIPEWKDDIAQAVKEVDEERARRQKLDEDYKRAVIEANEREKRNRF